MMNNSPEEWSINGETASADEIALMELLASDILAKHPAEGSKQYDYFTESGSFVSFTTRVFGEDAAMGSHASVMIASGTPEDVKLEVVYGYDNQLRHIDISMDTDLGEITSIIQDLLEADDIEPSDAIVLRHLQSQVLHAMTGGRASIQLAMLPDCRYVGDIIRSLVDKNTTYMMMTKAWGLPLGDDHVLNVASNEIIGELPEDDDEDNDDVLSLPRLEVTYENRRQRVIYTYTRLLNGEVLLDTIASTGADGEGPASEDIEEAIATFTEALGGRMPGKHDVGLMTDKLLQAILLPTK